MRADKLSKQERLDIQSSHSLWQQLAKRDTPYAFSAQTVDETKRWQTKTRRALNRLIGFQDLPVVTPRPKRLESVDKGDYVREKILLHTAENITMPVYLLLPKTPGPHPSVLAFHGHGYGVKDIVGLEADGNERTGDPGYHKDFAVALCRRGFAVAAPEISSFGERGNDYSYLKKFGLPSPIPPGCSHTAALALHLGGSALGLRILDAKRLVDYLATHPQFDTKRLGAMGISGGGMHSFFSTCLDTRIRACVVSGYFCAYEHSILAMHHCICNFVPGLARFGDIHDLAGLIAPRPMLIEAGTRDPIFPLPAVKQAVKRTRPLYRLFDEPKHLQTDFFEGEHEISGAKAYDFLWKHLQ